MQYARLISALAVFVVLAVPVSAQQSASTGEAPTARLDPTPPDSSSNRKAPGRAVLYSAGGTVLLLPVGGVGLVVGPAFGHFYAGDSQQAWTGIAIRAGSAGAAGLGGILALGAPRVGWGLLTVGAFVVVGSALYDIVTALHSAQDYNEAHGLSARVAPTVEPRGAPVGVTLQVSF